jgi:hypothetical protein
MYVIDDNHVKIHNALVVWDGITNPEDKEGGGKKYSLKVVVEPSNQDLNDFRQLASSTLQQSEFKGVLPAGGRMPEGQAGPSEFEGMFNGWAVLNCNTNRLPEIFSEAGKRIDSDPMQYGQLIYGGQAVDIVVHCYAYNAKGNKGVATGLDGFMPLPSRNAQRINFGGGGVSTESAFGGGGSTAQAATTAAPAQKFDPNTGQPIVTEAAPAQRFDPNTGQPIADAAPAPKFDPLTGERLDAGATQVHTFIPTQ